MCDILKKPLKIIGLTDIHGDHEYIDLLGGELEESDAIVISGDITNFGGRDAASVILDRIRKFNTNIFAVPGNCDESDVNILLDELRIGVHGSSRSLNGFRFAGAGGALKSPGMTPTTFTEGEFTTNLSSSVRGIDPESDFIMISHQPPKKTKLDMVLGFHHVGSRAVRAFIEEYQPLLCFCGHIHEAAGTDKIGRTLIINPGPFNRGGYARVEIVDGKINHEIRRVGK